MLLDRNVTACDMFTPWSYKNLEPLETIDSEVGGVDWSQEAIR